MQPVASPMQGTVVSIDVAEGDVVRVGRQLVVLESMKMEHVITAESAGVIASIPIAVGETVMPGDTLVLVEPREGVAGADDVIDVAVDLEGVRADRAEVRERHEVGLDHRRPEAVARRRATGQRTARENVDDLLDEGSFVEYAPLVVAAQRRRRSISSSCGRISRRRSTGTTSGSTIAGPMRSRGGARPGSAPRVRTSPTSWMTAASWSTRRSWSPRNAGAGRWKS